MESLEQLLSYLKAHPEVTEISLEYLNGDKDKYDVAELEGIKWEEVDEAEIELADGSKLAFGEADDDDEEDSDDDEDEEDDEDSDDDDDDDDEQASVSAVGEEDEEDEDDEDDDDDDDDNDDDEEEA